MPKKKGYGQRDALINSRKQTADQIDLTLGGSGQTARPGFGPMGPGRKIKESNQDEFTTHEQYQGDRVDDYELKGKV
jgi:hypothetical protein